MKICAIEDNLTDLPTWGIEVDEVHEYCMGNGVVSHNTSGKVTNATEGAEPIMDLFYVETGTHNLPTVVKGRGETRNFYEKCWDIDPKVIINHAIIRQIYIDQSQSWTQYYKKPESVKELFEDVYYASQHGIKTFYYLKTQKTESEEVCSSCSS